MIPLTIQHALVNYREARLHPGSFVTSMLANDLFAALHYADEETKDAIVEIATTIRNSLPASAYGDYDKVQCWLDGIGGRGL